MSAENENLVFDILGASNDWLSVQQIRSDLKVKHGIVVPDSTVNGVVLRFIRDGLAERMKIDGNGRTCFGYRLSREDRENATASPHANTRIIRTPQTRPFRRTDKPLFTDRDLRTILKALEIFGELILRL